MKIKSLLVLVAFAIGNQISFAQTADEVVNKHLEAMGGKDKLANLKTLKLSCSMEIAPGMKAPINMFFVNNQCMRVEVEVQGMKILSAVEGDSGWSINPMSGKKDAERMNSDEIKESKDQMDLTGALYNYKEKGNAVELLGKEDMEGTEVYKLKITKKSGDIEYDFIDATTYLKLKETTTHKFNDKEVSGDVIYSDYRKSGDIMFPFSMDNRQTGESQGQVMTVESIEVNPTIDRSIFKMPPPQPAAVEEKK
ncbi:MAG: outer membrane lipoprotein-sorting protein [Bacteroidetes bacterium]|nr:outer membrane lipoprotein-sorting protein [Bacteroidota bacterium]